VLLPGGEGDEAGEAQKIWAQEEIVNQQLTNQQNKQSTPKSLPVPTLSVLSFNACVMDGGIMDLEPHIKQKGFPEHCTKCTKHFITVLPHSWVVSTK
jgi:hypothetical protein